MSKTYFQFLNKSVALVLTFTFLLSGLEYDPITAWAQEPEAGSGTPLGATNQTNFGIHTPCFPHGSHGANHATYDHGNQTHFMMHQFSRNAAWVGNGTGHFIQYGNHTGFRMIPCTSQNSTSINSGNVNPSATQNGPAILPTTSQIPSWVRNNAKWWSQGQMGDSDFIQGVQYLVQQGIMKIPPTQTNQTSLTQQIPVWVKTNAKWWSQGQISDDDFIKGIQYLISSGIVKV